MGHSLKGDVTDYHYKHIGHKYLYDDGLYENVFIL